jgi:nucleotide-binding universal stress UspA family protein
MKKFLAAFDPLRFAPSTMSYAIHLAKLAGAHLVGVFLEDPNLHSYSVAELTHYEGKPFDHHLRELNEKDDRTRSACIDTFRHACSTGGVSCSVHRDRNVPLQELLHESIYADLLFISSAETLELGSEPSPTRFIRGLLQDVQCPVLLVPSEYRPIDHIVLLYDGEPSSVFALRMFSYLFEPIRYLPTNVITVKHESDGLHLPDPRLIREFVKRHFPDAEYTVLKGDAEESIIRHLLRLKGAPLIALGAYRRSRLSRLFRPSMADLLVQQVEQPLFIAHNRS